MPKMLKFAVFQCNECNGIYKKRKMIEKHSNDYIESTVRIRIDEIEGIKVDFVPGIAENSYSYKEDERKITVSGGKK